MTSNLSCGYDTLTTFFVYGFQILNEFFNCINSLHPTIKFTMDYSTAEINFLNVTITKTGNKLITDL